MDCPIHLSDEAKAIWAHIVEQFDTEFDHRVLLREALEAWDTAQLCRARVAADGAIVKHPNGMEYINPHHKAEMAARAYFLKAWKDLGVGYMPPEEKK